VGKPGIAEVAHIEPFLGMAALPTSLLGFRSRAAVYTLFIAIAIEDRGAPFIRAKGIPGSPNTPHIYVDPSLIKHFLRVLRIVEAGQCAPRRHLRPMRYRLRPLRQRACQTTRLRLPLGLLPHAERAPAAYYGDDSIWFFVLYQPPLVGVIGLKPCPVHPVTQPFPYWS
jgi:hypothetical protein